MTESEMKRIVSHVRQTANLYNPKPDIVKYKYDPESGSFIIMIAANPDKVKYKRYEDA